MKARPRAASPPALLLAATIASGYVRSQPMRKVTAAASSRIRRASMRRAGARSTVESTVPLTVARAMPWTSDRKLSGVRGFHRGEDGDVRLDDAAALVFVRLERPDASL